MSLFDFLFGSDSESNIEDYRSISEDRRHRASGSSNWTSLEDWNCDPTDRDYDHFSGFDPYDDNDF